MPFGLGFFAVAGAGAAGSYDLLETQVLGSSQASVTFSSLSTYASTYKHLQLRLTSQPVADGATIWVRFNGDAASSYNHHFVYTNGGAVTSGNGATANGVLIGGVAGFKNTHFMGAVMDILDFSDTNKNKVTRTLSGSSSEIDLASGMWRNTAAITSLTVFWTGTNASANSRFSLYGIRGV